MKLQCQVEVVNRNLSTLNIRTGSGKYSKATIALGKEQKKNEYFILLFTALNKTGARYRINNNVKQVFAKFLSEGKTTIRFVEPAHDLCIRCEAIQLKSFLKLLQQCITGQKVNLCDLSNISVTSKDQAPTKLVIKDRSEFPSKGLPRSLLSLTLAGLKLCAFRRDILQLRHLTVLDLRNNEMEKIPPEFGRMPCISELYLANNKLGGDKNIDWRWLLEPQICKSLRLLDLSNNELSHLPSAIRKLDGLLNLKVDQNSLTRLPHSLSSIKTLRYLSLASNKLQFLPSGLLHAKLQHIDLSSNEFTSQVLIKEENHSYALTSRLTRMAGVVVVKHKISYNSHIIPHTLVDFLDNILFCICGGPVMDHKMHAMRRFQPKDFISITSDCNLSIVSFECYFCSHECMKKWT